MKLHEFKQRLKLAIKIILFLIMLISCSCICILSVNKKIIWNIVFDNIERGKNETTDNAIKRSQK